MAAYDFEQPQYDFLIPQQFDKVGSGVPTPVLKKFYFHRAWNTVELNYETWVSQGIPQPNPPSGDPITGLTTAAFWRMVI